MKYFSTFFVGAYILILQNISTSEFDNYLNFRDVSNFYFSFFGVFHICKLRVLTEFD